ncbi:uncharacterized protein IWZ02DRAFT_112995 [Phyllosticta citriasiana]|uniref:uncharacterized protein n=1 Tax=Phyllosticta citriasiana TaxID=595635 RepID=UPI0030FDE535
MRLKCPLMGPVGHWSCLPCLLPQLIQAEFPSVAPTKTKRFVLFLLHAPSRVTEATSTAPLVSPARRYTSSSDEADAFLTSFPLQPSSDVEVKLPLTATESSVSSTGSGKRKAEGEDGPAAKRSRMR